MLVQSLLLFLSAALGGVAVLIIRKPNADTFKQLLVLAGGYLNTIQDCSKMPQDPLNIVLGYWGGPLEEEEQ